MMTTQTLGRLAVSDHRETAPMKWSQMHFDRTDPMDPEDPKDLCRATKSLPRCIFAILSIDLAKIILAAKDRALRIQ